MLISIFFEIIDVAQGASAVVDAGLLGVLICGGDHVVVERLLLAHPMDVRSVGNAPFRGSVHRDDGLHDARTRWAQQLRAGHSQRALCPWRDNESRI